MREAIGEILPLAVGVALSPLPIVAVVLMLVTPRARVNGPAFVVGWLVGLAVVGAIVLLAASGADASEEGEPATWVGDPEDRAGRTRAADRAAAVAWASPRRGGAAGAEVDGGDRPLHAPKALAAGVRALGREPKNLLLAVGCRDRDRTDRDRRRRAGRRVRRLHVIGTVGVAAPVVIFFALGDRAGPLLARLKDWMEHNNATIMAVLLAVIGAKPIGDGIAGF